MHSVKSSVELIACSLPAYDDQYSAVLCENPISIGSNMKGLVLITYLIWAIQQVFWAGKFRNFFENVAIIQYDLWLQW